MDSKPVSFSLKQLLRDGKSKGYLTTEEIKEFFPAEYLDSEKLEENSRADKHHDSGDNPRGISTNGHLV